MPRCSPPATARSSCSSRSGRTPAWPASSPSRGEGLHHLCFETSDVDDALARLRTDDVPLLDREPRQGLAGRIAFLHPKACDGVLVELATPPHGGPTEESPVRLKRLVIGCSDPQHTGRIYQRLFALPEVAGGNGGARAMLGWTGGGTILMVPAGEVGGMEGMVALSMVAPEIGALIRRLESAGGDDADRRQRGDGRAALIPRRPPALQPLPLPLIVR